MHIYIYFFYGMVLLPIEIVPLCKSTTWYLYQMVLLPSKQVEWGHDPVKAVAMSE